jgi:hypothetical protein
MIADEEALQPDAPFHQLEQVGGAAGGFARSSYWATAPQNAIRQYSRREPLAASGWSPPTLSN